MDRLIAIFLVFALTMSAKASSYTVNVQKPGTLSAEIRKKTSDFLSITELTVTGMLDDYDDLECVSEMQNLEKVDLSGAVCSSIGSSFSGLEKLREVRLPNSVKEIESSAFSDCLSLTLIDMPGVESIEMMAFFNCPELRSLTLPSTLKSMSPYWSMWGTAIGTIYCYAVIPPASFSLPSTEEGITLYVPACSVEAYREILYETSYEALVDVVSMNVKIDDCYVARDYAFSTTSGLGGTNLHISENPSLGTYENNYDQSVALTIDAGKNTWNLNKFSMRTKMNDLEEALNKHFQTTALFYQEATSLYNKQTPIEANEVEVTLKDISNDWVFFSLPFDVQMKDITMPSSDSKLYIRRYSGENRSKLDGHTWLDVKDNEMLNANEGYILYRSHFGDEDDDAGNITFKAANTIHKNDIFTFDDVTLNLKPYPAAAKRNSGWNYVGNPYPCYYNIGWIEEDAILTMYYNEKYYTFSTRDDNYVMPPLTGFFVQCDDQCNTLTFHQEGREAKHRYKEFELPWGDPLYEWGEEDDNDDDANDDDDDDDDWWNDDDDDDDDDWWNDDNDDDDDNDDNDWGWNDGEEYDEEWLREWWKEHYGDIPFPLSKQRRAISSERKIYNFILSDSKESDRTRLVVNPNASMAYELQRDASKFMSTNMSVPQVFISDDGDRLAIDERPLGDGMITLGVYVGKAGIQKLHLDTADKDCAVMLIDNYAGKTINLAESDYTFEAESGMQTGRFIVCMNGEATALERISKEKSNGSEYDILGRKINDAEMRGIIIRDNKKILNK